MQAPTFVISEWVWIRNMPGQIAAIKSSPAPYGNWYLVNGAWHNHRAITR